MDVEQVDDSTKGEPLREANRATRQPHKTNYSPTAPIRHLSQSNRIDTLVDPSNPFSSIDIHKHGESSRWGDSWNGGSLVTGDFDGFHTGTETYGRVNPTIDGERGRKQRISDVTSNFEAARGKELSFLKLLYIHTSASNSPIKTNKLTHGQISLRDTSTHSTKQRCRSRTSTKSIYGYFFYFSRGEDQDGSFG